MASSTTASEGHALAPPLGPPRLSIPPPPPTPPAPGPVASLKASTFAVPGYDTLVSVEAEVRVAKGTSGGAFNDLVLLLDKSWSMSCNEQLETAKQAIEVIIQHFCGPWDRVSLLAFDHGIQEVFPLCAVTEEGKEDLIKRVKEIALGGSTNIQIAVENALEQLKSRGEKDKSVRVSSVLLLTDGQHCGAFSDTKIKALHAESGTPNVYCLAIGSGADQPFLFGLAERFGGQAAYIDTKKDLKETVMGTLSRFFGALSSIAAKSACLTLDFAPAASSCEVDISSSVIPTIFKAARSAKGCAIDIGSLMVEQVVHVTLMCRLVGNPFDLPGVGAAFGTLTFQYSDLRALAKSEPLVAGLTMPAQPPAQKNVVVIERLAGGVTLDEVPGNDGERFTLEVGGPDRRVTVDKQARLHLADVTLEPLENCVLRLAMVTDPASPGGHKVSVILESGLLYIHTTDVPLEVRRLPDARTKMQVQWHLRPASAAAITLPTSSSTAHLLSPSSPSIVLPTSPSPRPLSPLTPSVGASHRLLLDVGTAAHPANTLLNLGGTVTLHDAVHHVSLPVLHEVMLPERISVPDFKPSRAEIDSLVKCLSVPSFAEDIARLQRKNERQVVQVLRGLLEAGTLQSDTSLESVRHLLDDSLPSVLERALAEAAQSQGQPRMAVIQRQLAYEDLKINRTVLEHLASQPVRRLLKEVERISEMRKSNSDRDLCTGTIRQLAQVLEQERAMVDGPNSTLYANVSQRTFTLEGFKQLQLDTAKLEERYKEDFHEDPEALLAEFNEMKEVKRNELGIREGQVGVYAHMFEKQIIHPPTPGAVKGKRLAGSVRILPPQGGTKVPTPRPSKEGEAFSPRPSTARDRSTSGTRASTSGADASTGRPSSVSLGGRDSTCSIPEKEAITTVAEGGGATGSGIAAIKLFQPVQAAAPEGSTVEATLPKQG